MGREKVRGRTRTRKMNESWLSLLLIARSEFVLCEGILDADLHGLFV